MGTRVAVGAVATVKKVLLLIPYPQQSPTRVHAPGDRIEPACPPQGGQQGRQGWEGLPRGKTGRSTQEMLPCCGCSRNVLEAQGSLASTGAWFLCPPGVTRRDETSEVLPACESLVVSCPVGINEKGARVEGAPGRSGGGARAKCVYTVRQWFPVALEPLRDAANKRIPVCQIPTCQKTCGRDPSRAAEGGDATYLGLAGSICCWCLQTCDRESSAGLEMKKNPTYDGDAVQVGYCASALHWGSHMYQELRARGEAPNEVMKLRLLGVSVPHRSTKSPMAQTQPLHGFSAGTFLLQYVGKPRSHVADCMTRCFARRSRPHRVPACDTMYHSSAGQDAQLRPLLVGWLLVG